MRLPVYLDNHATTPLDPRVLKAMLPYMTEDFGNASSSDHVYGARASEAVETARQKVARLIGAVPEEVIFTSGATEADNHAVLGVAEWNPSKRAHFVTSTVEHKAILDTFGRLESAGRRVTYLPVNTVGTVSPDTLRRAISQDTVLVSVILANNEIGTIQNMRELSEVTHERGALLHTDAAQAIGHIPVHVDEMGIDLMSLSAHKAYGPKGVGGLFVRRRRNRVSLGPLLTGGGQERGLRSGTLNVPGVVGMGSALELAQREMESEGRRERKLRDHLQERLLDVGDVKANGQLDSRLPHNLNVKIGKVDGKALIAAVSHRVAFSASSACSTQTVEPSHVLLAIGYSPQEAHQCVRFGLGRFTTSEEADFAASELTKAIGRLRRLA